MAADNKLTINSKIKDLQGNILWELVLRQPFDNPRINLWQSVNETLLKNITNQVRKKITRPEQIIDSVGGLGEMIKDKGEETIKDILHKTIGSLMRDKED